MLTAEWLHAFAQPRLGHKGLFLVRLDETGASPALIPFAHNLYHNRNRTYAPGLGRFLQRDPNQTAMALVEATAMHGRGLGALSLAFSMEGLYGDGGNLYEYLGSNPWTRSDVLGLSWDPFDMVDDFLAETTGNRAAVMERLVGGVRAAAYVGAVVASALPFPLPTSILADVGASALEGSVSPELQDFGRVMGYVSIGAVSVMAGKIGYSALKSSIAYVQKHGMRGALRNLWNSGIGLAQRGYRWVKRKTERALGRRRCGGCFAAATVVWTASGAVPIADLDGSQAVLAAPDDGSALAVQFASDYVPIVIGEASLVTLTIAHADGSLEAIKTTDEHPFHVAAANEWSRADALQVGDSLTTLTGDAAVRSIRYGGERVPVYNLSIPGSPTYYVGERGVWVHNCSWSAAREAYWSAKGLASPPQAQVEVLVRKTGEIKTTQVSKELHHINGRDIPDPHDISNLMEVWPWEHEAVDSFRHTGYELRQVIRIWEDRL